MFRRKPAPSLPVEGMLVGLGNPGAEYRGTRHNVGFDVVDRLAKASHAKMTASRHRAMVGTVDLGGTRVLLVKPLTYMNLSGQAVAPLLREHGLEVARLLVVADDLDLPVGKLRLKAEGSAGGHNGHKSLIASLRTNAYSRLKIGIGKVDRSSTIDHVLGPFMREEREPIDAALEASCQVCEAFFGQGFDAAQRVIERFHQR